MDNNFNNTLTQEIKLGQSIDNIKEEELKKFRLSINSDSMGFDEVEGDSDGN